MKRAIRTLAVALLAAGVSVPAACGSDSNPAGPGEETLPAFTMTLSPDTLTLAPGETAQVTVTWVRPSGTSGSTTIRISNGPPPGVNFTDLGGVGNTNVWEFVASPTAQAGTSTMPVSVSGSGATGASKMLVVRVVS